VTTIMLTGGNGQLGWELHKILGDYGRIIAFDHFSLDLTDHKKLRSTIQELKPDLIINSAAYTNVKLAENNRQEARLINSIAPEIMAEEAKKYGAFLIHYSTDYVFDGRRENPYQEQDETNPLNEYGMSKLIGEDAIRNMDVPHFIFRTSWVYSIRGNNFLLSIVRLLKEEKQLDVVNDQFGSPTWCHDIADITDLIFSQVRTPSGIDIELLKDKSGTYHLTSKGIITWFDYARKILAYMNEHSLISTQPIIHSISSSAYDSKIKRPKYSVLCTNKIEQTFDLICPEWDYSLNLCMNELFNQ